MHERNVQSIYIKPVLTVHRKKKIREFPVPSRDVTAKLSLGGNNDVITKLFLPRGSLVSDIPAGDGILVNLFLWCLAQEQRNKHNCFVFLLQIVVFFFIKLPFLRPEYGAFFLWTVDHSIEIIEQGVVIISLMKIVLAYRSQHLYEFREGKPVSGDCLRKMTNVPVRK